MTIFLIILCLTAGLGCLIGGLICACMDGKRKWAALQFGVVTVAFGVLPHVFSDLPHNSLWVEYLDWLPAFLAETWHWCVGIITVAVFICFVTVLFPFCKWELWGENLPSRATKEWQLWDAFYVGLILAATGWYTWYLWNSEFTNDIFDDAVSVKAELDELKGREPGGIAQMAGLRYALPYYLDELTDETEESLINEVQKVIDDLPDDHRLKQLQNIALTEDRAVLYATFSTDNWERIVVFVDGSIPGDSSASPPVSEEIVKGEKFVLVYDIDADETMKTLQSHIEQFQSKVTELNNANALDAATPAPNTSNDSAPSKRTNGVLPRTLSL